MLQMDCDPRIVAIENIHYVWMNISQEALSTIDQLKKAFFIRELSVEGDKGQNQIAYQV